MNMTGEVVIFFLLAFTLNILGMTWVVKGENSATKRCGIILVLSCILAVLYVLEAMM